MKNVCSLLFCASKLRWYSCHLLFLAFMSSSTQAGPRSDNEELEWANNKAVVKISNTKSDLRAYKHTSTLLTRNRGHDKAVIEYKEQPGQMRLRTNSLVLDALFTLAIEEASQNSVSAIRDPGFNYGREVACECFQTGEKWRYVWTRDSAYAIDLALGHLDPTRSTNSLEFKISNFRVAGFEQRVEIVQDTGSGGSWPVSSDRVTWAMAAWTSLKHLSGHKRTAFLETSFEAIKNTIETDRIAVYDKRDGLYKGEQSFLDWREQSYASWTQNSTVHIAETKALSTNVNHYLAIKYASLMAEELGEFDLSERYFTWHTQLKESINEGFWLEQQGIYASLKATGDNPATYRKYDLLGISLAIISGVASEQRGRLSLSNYPNSEIGAPVLWPQQPRIPVYHNRAIWPFVTAYALRAARKVGHSEFIERNLQVMIGASATNISNMENLEFLTGQPYFNDGPYSGPLVNSRRQLWSVAGYISSIKDILVGIDFNHDSDQISFAPLIPEKIRKKFLTNSQTLSLENFRWREKSINVKVQLPRLSSSLAEDRVIVADRVLLNGREVQGPISYDSLENSNTVEVATVYRNKEESVSLKVVSVKDPSNLAENEWKSIWSPIEPIVDYIERTRSGNIELTLNRNSEQKTLFNIYRNGTLIAEAVDSEVFEDDTVGEQRACYSAEQFYDGYENYSHHSKTQCLERFDDRILIPVNDSRLSSSGNPRMLRKKDRYYYSDWGKPNEELLANDFGTRVSGNFKLRIEYANAHNTVNLGITASNKFIEVFNRDTNEVVATGVVSMPQLPSWSNLGFSTEVPMKLEAGKRYYVRISDYMNMTYLEHFSLYTAGAGGEGGFLNRCDIFGVEIKRAPDK